MRDNALFSHKVKNHFSQFSAIFSLKTCLLTQNILAIHARYPTGEKKSNGISADLMVLRQGMPISRFLEKIDFFYFRYILFILRRWGRKQTYFIGKYDLNRLTRLKINTFSSVILLTETFSKWNSHLYANTNLSRHLVTNCQLMHHLSHTSKIAVSFYGEHCFHLFSNFLVLEEHKYTIVIFFLSHKTLFFTTLEHYEMGFSESPLFVSAGKKKTLKRTKLLKI